MSIVFHFSSPPLQYNTTFAGHNRTEAFNILNKGVRPFLVDWHTKLSSFETEQAKHQREQHGPDVTVIIDESQWAQADAFYTALEEFRVDFLSYVHELELIAGLRED